MVEFSAPFFILSRWTWRAAITRSSTGSTTAGKIGATSNFPPAAHLPSTNNPLTNADIGDGLLLRLGYAIVDAGWQGDVAPGNNRSSNLPVATQPDGSPIVAAVRIEYSDRTIPRPGPSPLTWRGVPTSAPTRRPTRTPPTRR